MEHNAYRFFEIEYFKYLKWILTHQWHLLQGGDDARATSLWLEVLWVLEIDAKGVTDLFLLAQCGEGGRAEANEILWHLMTFHGLDQEYKDLSNLVSNQVHRARRNFERPPGTHKDRGTWYWERYNHVRNPAFSPLQVPCRQGYGLPDSRRHLTGPGGIPLAPPRCWSYDWRDL